MLGNRFGIMEFIGKWSVLCGFFVDLTWIKVCNFCVLHSGRLTKNSHEFFFFSNVYGQKLIPHIRVEAINFEKKRREKISTIHYLRWEVWFFVYNVQEACALNNSLIIWPILGVCPLEKKIRFFYNFPMNLIIPHKINTLLKIK